MVVIIYLDADADASTWFLRLVSMSSNFKKDNAVLRFKMDERK